MAKTGGKSAKVRRVSPIKPNLRGASRLVQSRLHAGIRSATLSRRSMLKFSSSVLLVFLALALVALWLGGHLSSVRDSATQFKQNRLMAMGFTVQRIDVTGEGRLIEADVRAAMGIYEGDYFFGADLERAQQRVETLPWVDHALVRRLWPNRIVVQLVEETPYALYQQDGRIHLTDRDGAIVAPLTAQTASLPDDLKLFIGQNAAQHAWAISETLQGFPDIWHRTESLTRHPSGRWDLTWTDGTRIRLPKAELTQSLRRLRMLQPRLQNNYAVVDLRLPDRLTLTPAPTPVPTSTSTLTLAPRASVDA